MSKSKQIIKLLQSGKPVKEIARKLKVKPQYVYTVRSKNKQKSSKIIAVVKETKAELNAMVGKTVGGLTFVRLDDGNYRWIRNDLAANYLKPKSDPVNHPPHYKSGGIETIDFIEAKDLNYRLGNVVKYVSRAGRKDSDPVQDLEKAAWYLKREIEARKSA